MAPARFSFRWLILLSLLLAVAAPRASSVAEEEKKPEGGTPPKSRRSITDDAHYERVLKVYRGQVSREEALLITEVDPAPSLFLGQIPQLRNLARVFASLPDSAHAELRKTGFLKWKLDALPGEQRRWVSEMANRLTDGGEGPFKSSVTTGFIGVPARDEDGHVYSWWIDADKAIRPVWFPLVRARGFGGEMQFQAHKQLLIDHRKTPVSETIPGREWLKFPEPPRLDIEVVAQEEAIAEFSREYALLIRAYQGKLNKEQLQSFVTTDPLLVQRIGSKEAHERALGAFFVRLSEAEHQKLRDEGRIQWTSGQLTPVQKRILTPLIQEMNRRAAEGGNPTPYSLEGPVGCIMGFTFVEVPKVEKLVLSWWIRSAGAPIPTWISLNNDAAVKAPGYYQAHLAQLGR